MSITAAIGLLKFVPEIVGLFSKKHGDNADKVANTVKEIAADISGKSTADEQEAYFSANPELAHQFRLAVMADKYVDEQMRLDDVKSARTMYSGQNEQADKIANSVIRYNLIIVAVLLSLDVIAMILLQDKPTILAMIATLFGGVMQSLISERQSVIGFFFGSSLGSKMKTDKI